MWSAIPISVAFFCLDRDLGRDHGKVIAFVIARSNDCDRHNTNHDEVGNVGGIENSSLPRILNWRKILKKNQTSFMYQKLLETLE